MYLEKFHQKTTKKKKHKIVKYSENKECQEKRWAFGPGEPLRKSPNLLLPHGPLLSLGLHLLIYFIEISVNWGGLQLTQRVWHDLFSLL